MILNGNSLEVLKTMPDCSVQMCVTSPPYYGLRDYGIDGQIGLEETPQEFIEKLVDVFREVRRVLKDDGVLWVNIGDSYCGTGDNGNYKDPKYANGRNGQTKSLNKDVSGCKHKDLIGIPWMLAFALRADGWYLRQDIIWHKPNPMPESVKDRCTKSHEYIFLLSKSNRYFFDADAVSEDADSKYESRYKYVFNAGKAQEHFRPNGATNNTMGMKEYSGKRNKRDVWTVTTKPYKGAHFATYPEELILPCILAGSRKGDTVLDPFNGAGTTGVVCRKQGREYIGIELNPEYVKLSEERIKEVEDQLYMEENQFSIFKEDI